MIKKIFTTLVLIISIIGNSVNATEKVTPDITRGIQQYKSGNYTGCIQTMKRHIIANQNEQNQLVLYYLGMSYTKAGIPDLARLYYEETRKINSNNTLGQYASRGIACLNGEEACYAPTEEKKVQEAQTKLDQFINAPYGNGLSADLNKELERKKLERLRKEMNADDNLNRFEFQNFMDYAKKKSLLLKNDKIASNQPTDAEIVNALRVLDAAGLSNFVQQKNTNQEPPTVQSETTVKSEYKPDVTKEEFQQQIQRDMMAAQMAQLTQPNINMLFGDNNNNNNSNNNTMMNMLPFMMAQQAQNGQQQAITPDVMQAMMFGSMMPNFDFSSGSNR